MIRKGRKTLHNLVRCQSVNCFLLVGVRLLDLVQSSILVLDHLVGEYIAQVLICTLYSGIFTLVKILIGACADPEKGSLD